MMEVHLEEEFHATLDCDNVMDWQGNLTVWNMRQSKVGTQTELFHSLSGTKAQMEESLAALVAVFRPFLRPTAMTSRSTVLDTKIWI